MTDDAEVRDAVRIERTIDAPVELVWRLWTEPTHFESWWGPEGAVVSVATMDVRVGGTRLVRMQASTPGGPRVMWFTGEHREVIVNQRLVYTESMADEDGNVLTPAQLGMPDGHPVTTEVIVELADADGGTHMVMTHVGIPADSPGATGWTMAFDKLAAVVASR